LILSSAISACAGPLVLLGNEPSPDLPAFARDARQFVDALGDLDRQAAAACERVTLMSAGLAMTLKGIA
jgi:adenosylcobinamide kinase/adenosylcobinamide-phosphate guanylyltransferase